MDHLQPQDSGLVSVKRERQIGNTEGTENTEMFSPTVLCVFRALCVKKNHPMSTRRCFLEVMTTVGLIHEVIHDKEIIQIAKSEQTKSTQVNNSCHPFATVHSVNSKAAEKEQQ